MVKPPATPSPKRQSRVTERDCGAGTIEFCNGRLYAYVHYCHYTSYGRPVGGQIK